MLTRTVLSRTVLSRKVLNRTVLIKTQSNSALFYAAASYQSRSNHAQPYRPGLKNRMGYTLVELMIALTLGLLVVAAGLGVLISGHRVLALQAAMDELQENANLGLGLIALDLRQINLNTTSPQQVNPWNVGSGIIFNGQNLPPQLKQLPENIWTAQDSIETSTDLLSDQLLIQYVPQRHLTGQSVFNCEGEKLDLGQDHSAKALTVVNRYYLRQDPQQIAGEPTGYALYCDSGYYREGDQRITGLTAQGGAQMMKRVEALKLNLAVQNATGQIAYLSVKDYLTLSAGSEAQSYNVIGVEIGLLVRASTRLGQVRQLNVPQRFELLGHEIKMKASSSRQGSLYLRQSMSQMVAIRNALGGAVL